MKKVWYLYQFTIYLSFLILFNLHPAQAQVAKTDVQEVYLDFRHRGAVSSVIIAYYGNNTFYLPVVELFNLLEFDNSVSGLSVTGNFAAKQTPYRLDFNSNKARFGNTETELNRDGYVLSELDFYLTPELFSQIFGLDFSVNFNNLTLQLETTVAIPVVEKNIRARARSRLSDAQSQKENYELKYGREYPLLDGGFVDYNMTASYNGTQNWYRFNTNLGLQVAGGDLQGNIYGNFTDTNSGLHTSGLRWRYFIRDNTVLSQFEVGQTITDGVTRNQYTGIRLSNQPIEPRVMFDEYEIQGYTMPESEVELYLNNSLIDYQLADETGNYRFITPITYGSSQFDMKIYGPTGEIIERSNRVDIPFSFQPAGVFNYTLNAGQLENPLPGDTHRNYTVQGAGALGLTEWLTAKGGIEYFENLNNNTPYLTGSLSSRILSKYIVTLEGVSNAYYRGRLNVIYANSTSLNIEYTGFGSPTRNLYNPFGDNRHFSTGLYVPFKIMGLPANIRTSTTTRVRNNISNTSYRADLGANLNRLGFRLGFSDRDLTNQLNPFKPTSTGYFDGSLTYRIAQNPNVPDFIRGFYIRSSLRYYPKHSTMQSLDLLMSRNIFRSGQLQLGYNRNFVSKLNSFRFSLVIDFNTVRTSTSVNTFRNSVGITQNVRGSIGYDTNYNNVLFSSRNQVGRSGTAFNLFIDNDGDGFFTPGIDDSMPENAVRLDRTGSTSISKNGVLYLTQMHPYYYYNIEINKNALQNPMLVPNNDKFGAITDPNRFKKIEVPFYMSGVIEGKAEFGSSPETARGIGGLKLILKNPNSNFMQEIRTFSDGSFYAFEVPPGDYQLFVDEQQLSILDAFSEPNMHNFTIRPLVEGDFVEGLNFMLKPNSIDETVSEIPESVLRLFIKAQNEFYAGNIETALEYAQKSLEISETAQAFALIGSLHYLMDDSENAVLYWGKASELNPDIVIPDMNVLDYLINKEPRGKK